ncbi:hypothetical protein ACF0H5_012740 [Mactra antiquata]
MKRDYLYNILTSIRYILRVLWCLMIAINADIVKGLTGNEQRLFQNLTLGYNTIPRPVIHANEQVMLHFGITFNQIIDLDEKHQILSSYVWVHEAWYDENLSWSPEDFNGISNLMFPASEIWLPDIYIFNIAGSYLDGFVNVSGSNVVLSSDGLVNWSIPLHIKSACAVDATFFPYDKQICSIHFGSWIYDITQIDLALTSTKPDLTHYVTNNEFDLDGITLRRNVVNSSCCPGDGDHPIIRLEMRLKRKTNYYDYIVIAPTINLCVLTLATFLLPCECGWKIAIGLTVFLTLYVLQLLIAENVPDTNSTPLISVFLLLVMSLNCVSLITATIIMNIKRLSYLEPPPKVPGTLLTLCEKYLSKIICIRIADWKRIASNPLDQFDENEEISRELTDALKRAKDASVSAQYRQLKEFERKRANNIGSPVPGTSKQDTEVYHGVNRSTPTESCSSSNICTDNFISETCYTDHLLQGRCNDSSAIPHQQNINQSFQEDDSDNTEKHSPATYAETSFTTGNENRRLSRNRPSYRRAIRFGQTYSSVFQSESKSYQQSVMEGVSMKYQWYFVADVIDTVTFLIYLIVMFVGILTVLVITPLYA